MIAIQMDIGGNMMPAAEGKCDKCHRKLTDPVSIMRHLGPVCFGKIRAEMLVDSNHNLPRTITHQAVADSEIRKLSELFDKYSCVCGKSFDNYGDVWSFDHDAGLKLIGFGKPQHVYAHCMKCGHDTPLWQIMGVIRGE